MQCDVLIIGQGISGSILYHVLSREGLDCIVIDEEKEITASKVAAGLINPVTGRRLVKSWMIDELIASAEKIYRNIGVKFNKECIFKRELTWFFPAIDIQQAFEKRMIDQTDYLSDIRHSTPSKFFNYPYGHGNIYPCFVVDLQIVLGGIHAELKEKNKLLNEKFDHAHLKFSTYNVQYKNITAEKIIFCEGNSAINNPFFSQLPYSLNKGEALLLEINDLPKTIIYKFKQTLVPMQGNDSQWWYGSNYIWEFEDELPTKTYREMAEKELSSWLKLPFKIVDHKAAVRYATVERRPFVGFHPANNKVGIFNGWGTKGCSLVPYFAELFAKSISCNSPLLPEVDVARFTRVLSENK